MKQLETLFVYGTLMKGQTNHEVISDGWFIANGTTLNDFCMYELGMFPAVTEDEVTPIWGELFRVTPDVLTLADNLEGDLFNRIEVPVIIEMSGVITAWMYVSMLNEEDGVIIRDGKWKNSPT